MRVIILAVGKLKSGPEHELVERYLARSRAGGRALGLQDFQIREFSVARDNSIAQRKRKEAAALVSAMPDDAKLVVLDETGTQQTSGQFAQMIGKWNENAQRNLCFVIGGPDGLDPEIRARADLVLSFSPLTWPHQMVRVMLAEQLYRATTILAAHPYHKS
ncbi:23S rRNA (pseudouridine(1915)-N(3))-methyltransferase [hydrothermal vent metagenome]|uniref:23S rRNA (Pseudouridine(1915)-N(3))-methyltransferase n=1 Tax=hydrothermal vent metagenome TaxID=652676 RepID=A0A3B0TJY4_9ZZZZ